MKEEEEEEEEGGGGGGGGGGEGGGEEEGFQSYLGEKSDRHKRSCFFGSRERESKMDLK